MAVHGDVDQAEIDPNEILDLDPRIFGNLDCGVEVELAAPLVRVSCQAGIDPLCGRPAKPRRTPFRSQFAEKRQKGLRSFDRNPFSFKALEQALLNSPTRTRT
jgi:hypothetical protein